ncbi:hypothetical protein SOVF_156050 [Spinacia oleracea]|nr:hypothetical protein SOVF_156050 [Spinacia oleracea]
MCFHGKKALISLAPKSENYGGKFCVCAHHHSTRSLESPFWSSCVLNLHSEMLTTIDVSSVRASKSGDKRLSIFTGTKTLHLRCVSKEDRAAWIEALLAAKDLFPRVRSSNDFSPEDIVLPTDNLRRRMLQEGVAEPVIKDCESIMLVEVSELKNQFTALQDTHISLLET